MEIVLSRCARRAIVAFALLLSSPSLDARAASDPIEIHVDLTRAPQRILHARLALPAEPGPLTLLYPKYMPGEHGPTGPVAELAGLRIAANGEPIAWNRDAREVFAFHVEVPAGARSLEIELDYLPPRVTGIFGNGPATSDQLAVMSWNTLLLYPAGASIHELIFRPSLELPKGWEYGTALRERKRRGERVEFEPVTLAELVDSPVASAAHHRVIDLTGDAATSHRLRLFADSSAALAIRPETEAAFRKLVGETLRLFGGSRPYRRYDFLLSLSDHIDSFGLEHHESSDNRLPERALLDDAPLNANAGLLPHEFVHTWNAKFRRPVGLTRDDYQEPYDPDLLWVYEGLTSYLGDVLTARSGLWSPEYARDSLALIAAGLEHRPGRDWRPLVDTARAAYTLYGVAPEWRSWRRGVDFYEEGVLIWLEVDSAIRALSDDARSLDDFCAAFFAGAAGEPQLSPYRYEDLLAALQAVAPHDWARFFEERIYAVAPRAPLGGIENAGWRLVYSEKPNLAQADIDENDESIDLRFSLGVLLEAESGRLLDVLPGSPAAAAELAPGAELVAVNGRRWSKSILRAALAEAAESGEPIRLLVANSEFFREASLRYRGGERHPHLERITERADRLSAILAPRTP